MSQIPQNPQRCHVAVTQVLGEIRGASAFAFALGIGLFAWHLVWPNSAAAKMPTAVWHVAVSGQDSLFSEGLARDLSQALAEDTSLKVFDARRRGGGLLDSLYAKSPNPKVERLREALPPKIDLAIAVDCRPLENSLACRIEGRFLAFADKSVVDTGQYSLEALVQRRLFGACLARRWRENWRETKADWPAITLLVLKKPALPARLLRDLEILTEGPITHIPPGSTLETGDMGAPIVANRDRVDYLLYPAGVYAYPLPNVLQLLRGTLGVWHKRDTNTIAARLWQTTRLDSSNLVWRTLGKMAALDSTNLLWKSLGAANVLDSQNIVTRQLRALAGTDSGNLLLKSLSRLAALDTGNLVWRGIAQVGTLDSNNVLWRKLGQVASLDSGLLWRQLGMLAFQDSSVLLTPSCVLRGQPEILLLKHQGSETTLELVQGNLAVTPLLSSQGSQRMTDLQQGATRGFALGISRLTESRAEKVSAELAAVAELKSGKSLSQLLPGQLFSNEGVQPALTLDIQDFIANELTSVDIHPDRLGPLPWDAAGALPPMPSGKNEAGCYLCLPNRLGP